MPAWLNRGSQEVKRRTYFKKHCSTHSWIKVFDHKKKTFFRVCWRCFADEPLPCLHHNVRREFDIRTASASHFKQWCTDCGTQLKDLICDY